MAFSTDDAAHILRRLGFGGSPTDVANLAAMNTREDAANSLINFTTVDNSALDNIIKSAFDFSDPTNNNNFNFNQIRRWWYTRMVLTKRPFEEKMTLFWHNHFATAQSKVSSPPFMYIQNQTLRSLSLDTFDNLLLKVAQDPAMLIWLDGLTNVLGRPNENFARELQELFTMGINDVVTGQPNYTQTDVTQIARAFTGWRFVRTQGGGPLDYSFLLQTGAHDNGVKTIYSQSANYGGEDVITIIANRIATPRFLTLKLFEFFVYPLDITNPADTATIDKFANVYMTSGHSIKALVTSIFTSDEFFSDRARFGLIKNPAEVVVGSIQMLGGQYNPGAVGQNEATLYNASLLMGMDIFNPPDVSGWKLNEGWINTATMLERFNYSNQLITNRGTTGRGAFVPTSSLQTVVKPNGKKTVRGALTAMGLGDLGNPAFKTLRNYLQTDDNGNSVDFTGSTTQVDEKLRGLFHQIMSLPEYQQN